MMFKKLLLLLTLFSIAPALCMDPPTLIQAFRLGKLRNGQGVDYDDVVTIQMQEGTDFQVAVDLIQLSGTIKDLIEDAGTDNAIPLPNISAATWQLISDQLERVFKLRNKHGDLKQLEQDILDRKVSEQDQENGSAQSNAKRLKRR